MKDHSLSLVLACIDNLQAFKDQHPSRISFFVRLDGEEFGAPPVSAPTKRSSEPKTDRRRWNNIMGFDIGETFKSFKPGETRSYTLPPGRTMAEMRPAFRNNITLAMGERGWASIVTDGEELLVTRRKVCNPCHTTGGRKKKAD